MRKKDKLIKKITAHPSPANFTVRELDTLMSECGCDKFTKGGGRGSALKYIHVKTKRILTFDGPHPGKELYRYHIQKVNDFLKEVGEIKNKL